jgi:uncharacterized protein (DUF924 family)
MQTSLNSAFAFSSPRMLNCVKPSASTRRSMPAIMRFHSDRPTMPHAVLQFWFQEVTPAQWCKVDPAFDRLIAEHFGELHQQACKTELYEWRTDPQGRLAQVIVLDQFSSNIYRGQRGALEADPLALALAQTAVAGGHDLALSEGERAFLYMPFMHSESRRIHEVGRFCAKNTSRRAHKVALDLVGGLTGLFGGNAHNQVGTKF